MKRLFLPALMLSAAAHARLTPENGSLSLYGIAGGVMTISPSTSLSSTLSLFFPASAGSLNQVLATDGSGNLSWIAQSAGTAGNLTSGSGGILSVGNGTGAVLGTGTTVSIATAGAAGTGVLLASDWTTFNAKAAGFTQNAISGTSPVSVTGGGQVIGSATTISVATAGASASGIVTAADWTTFNAKQPNLGYTPVNKAGDTMSATLQAPRFQSTSSSASLPSLDVSGNGGNGIYSGGTNIVAFSTNSTQAMTIGSNQVVAALATNESTTTGNGALVVTGGLGVGKTLTAATVNVTGKIILANGSGYANAPEFSLPFSTGALTAISANEIVGSGKTTRAMKIENAVGSAATFTCATNPILTLLDCGTSTGACTAGTTTLASVTVTAANTLTDAGLSTTTVAAGHYWAWEVTVGACTVFDASGTAQAAMQ